MTQALSSRSRALFRVHAISGLLVLMGTPALAQTAPATADDADMSAFNGPAIAGICVFARSQVIERSKAGQAAAAKLRELAAQARAAREPERRAIVADHQALTADEAKLSQSDRQAREAGLAAREAQLAQKVDADNKRLAAARVAAISQFRSAMRPALVSAYKAHKCGLLLDRASVVGGNMTHDLTGPVLATLDERLPTLSPAIAPAP